MFPYNTLMPHTIAAYDRTKYTLKVGSSAAYAGIDKL